MRVLGLISGTSHDGIDCAVVDLRLDGSELVARVVHRDATPYAPELRRRLVAALPPAPTTFAEMCDLDTLIGQAFAEAAAAGIAAAVSADAASPTASSPAGDGVDLVVSHGQTVFHRVEGNRVLGTLQIGQPAWIAEATGVPVVSDIRIRDITAGGQGAPLASTIDALLLAGRGGTPAALNLGGISNATVVRDGAARAWDIGPAGALMDAVVLDRGAHPSGYDDGGALAAAGTVDEVLLDVLLDEPYYRLDPPKSTGKELFHLPYVQDAQRRAGRADLSTEDLLATLAELTVRTVAAALVAEGVTELFVSGGGAHNPVVIAGLERALAPARVTTTDELGLATDDKEAVLMALLGWMTVHGIPASVPSATGATGARLLGTITPGRDALQLPAPVDAPTSLRLELTTRP